jgi:hypothetical protein
MAFVSVHLLITFKLTDNQNINTIKKYGAWRLLLGSALSFHSLPAS